MLFPGLIEQGLYLNSIVLEKITDFRQGLTYISSVEFSCIFQGKMAPLLLSSIQPIPFPVFDYPINSVQ